MLSNAFALALLTTGACIVLYKKLPRRIRKLIEKHSLLTDFLSMLGIYMLLGGTLTALVAGAMCGLMISIMLHIANNPDDYLYIYDLKEFLSEKLAEAKEALNTYGKTYREKRVDNGGKVVDMPPMAS